jgi:hypothetical protein
VWRRRGEGGADARVVRPFEPKPDYGKKPSTLENNFLHNLSVFQS